MKKLVIALFCLVAFCLFSASGRAQKVNPNTSVQPEFMGLKGYKPAVPKNSPALQTLLDSAVSETLEKFKDKNLKPENVAATLIDLRDANNLQAANYRGSEKIYPASVVKMFYMNALEHWLELGRVKLTPELERGLKDMIVDSSNEATQYILDVLTGVSSGAELPEKEFTLWAYKRNVVNRFYINAQGYQNINVNQKTFCEDAYGIEQQFRGYKGNNRNMLTTNATARLLAEIVLGKTNTPERTKIMMDLMKRDPFAETKDQDDQAHGFTGIALINKGMKNARIWSKAGWTSKTRHDAAYIETPDGLKFVLVVFTENFATERNIIPTIAEKVLDNLGKIK
jgi:beta-lactamase class A